MISMSKSLQRQMKHFGSDTIPFQMLKKWSKNSNTKQVPFVWTTNYPVQNRNIPFFIFLRKSEEIMFDGSVGIFTRIFVEIIVDKTTDHIRFNIYENPYGRGSWMYSERSKMLLATSWCKVERTCIETRGRK